MTSATYSARLGEIADSQFDAALRRAGLGRFVAARACPGGLFGQNVFLTATSGEYVFRGAPHWYAGGPNDAWQFPKERLYADLLHAGTRVPVAWPQILDASCDHFPWPYLIMPRLPGASLGSPPALEHDDAVAVAAAMGDALAGLHALTCLFAGDFDPDIRAIAPYPSGYGVHLAGELDRSRAAARARNALTPEDEAWLDSLLDADACTPGPAATTYVHNDFNLGNVLFEKADGVWRVSGVADLMTSGFGDPAADLVRPACAWLDADPAAADAFLAAYRAAGGPAAPTAARLALLVAHERLLIWEYFTRPDAPETGLRSRAFSPWASRYADRLAKRLLQGWDLP